MIHRLVPDAVHRQKRIADAVHQDLGTLRFHLPEFVIEVLSYINPQLAFIVPANWDKPLDAFIRVAQGRCSKDLDSAVELNNQGVNGNKGVLTGAEVFQGSSGRKDAVGGKCVWHG